MKPGFTYMIGLLIAVVCCMPLFGCPSPPMERMVIKGSTTMAPMLERLAAEYLKPDQNQIIIEATGSWTGLKH